MSDPKQFNNAISCAVMVAAFNGCTMLVLFPCEIAFGMLKAITSAIVGGVESQKNSTEKFNKVLT